MKISEKLNNLGGSILRYIGIVGLIAAGLGALLTMELLIDTLMFLMGITEENSSNLQRFLAAVCLWSFLGMSVGLSILHKIGSLELLDMIDDQTDIAAREVFLLRKELKETKPNQTEEDLEEVKEKEIVQEDSKGNDSNI